MEKNPVFTIGSEIEDINRLYKNYLSSYLSDRTVPCNSELEESRFSISGKQAGWYLKSSRKIKKMISGGMLDPYYVSKSGLLQLSEVARKSIENEKEFGFLWLRSGDSIEPEKIIEGNSHSIDLEEEVSKYVNKGIGVAGSCHSHFVKEWEDIGPECQLSLCDTMNYLRHRHFTVETVIACTPGQATAVFCRKRAYATENPSISYFVNYFPFPERVKKKTIYKELGNLIGFDLDHDDLNCYAMPEKIKHGLYTTSYLDVPL